MFFTEKFDIVRTAYTQFLCAPARGGRIQGLENQFLAVMNDE